MSENNWVTLENGELLLFLHKHLPSLQANSHHEFNGLGKFLQLLDYLITNKLESSEAPMLEIRISQKEFQRFGSGKYYQKFIDEFFIPDPNYFYSEEAYHKPMKHTTFLFMKSFILEAQKHLRGSLGDDLYFKSLKINLNNPLKPQTISMTFRESKFLDKDILDLSHSTTTSSQQEEFITRLKSSEVLLTNKKDLKHFKHTLNDRQIRSLTLDKLTYTFEVKRLLKTQDSKPTLPTKAQLEENVHTQIKINLKALDKMIEEAKDFELNKLHAIKRAYQGNNNFLFYEKIKYRYHATSKLNTAPLLQGISKEIRNKLFSGFYQYDLTASAPTILHQLYEKLCNGEELKAVESYIINRSSLRALCADYLLSNDPQHYTDFKQAQGDVKGLFTALFYGGDSLNEQSDVAISYENRKQMMENIPEFKELALEAKKMFDLLYAEVAKNTNNDGNIIYQDILINPFKDKLDKNGHKIKRSHGSVLSEIYFYHEFQILNIARKQFPDIVLLVHDAIILDHKIMYEDLEEIVESVLGLKIHYEEELLG